MPPARSKMHFCNPESKVKQIEEKAFYKASSKYRSDKLKTIFFSTNMYRYLLGVMCIKLKQNQQSKTERRSRALYQHVSDSRTYWRRDEVFKRSVSLYKTKNWIDFLLPHPQFGFWWRRRRCRPWGPCPVAWLTQAGIACRCTEHR